MADQKIHWYPGHMAKTKRLIKEKYDLIDIVYEVLDARIPYSSKMNDLDDLIKNKPRIIIMNKKDLADINITNKWVKYYEDKGYRVILTNLKDDKSINEIVNLTKELTKFIQDKRSSKGLNNKTIRALVIGIPNVGKSTFINRMAGKNVANIGNNPGVTKEVTWLNTKYDISILDTPGILMPNLTDENVALNLASMSAIPRDILPVDKVAIYILNMLNDYYKDYLKNLYNIEELDNDNLDIMYDIIGHRIGAIVSGGNVDYKKVSNRILEDIKQEKIKGITFDRK